MTLCAQNISTGAPSVLGHPLGYKHCIKHSSPHPAPPCSAQVGSQSKKDATTYWGWEGQPKAWGYSSEGSGKPHPLVKKEEVMRDRTWFKAATTSEGAPTKATSVPHR